MIPGIFRPSIFALAMVAVGYLPMASLSETPKKEDLIWSREIPPDRTAADRHYLFKFVPKYRRDECIVQVDYVFSGSSEDYLAFFLFHGFQLYLFRYQPTAALVSATNSGLKGNQGRIFLIYADDCPLRFEITELAARFIEQRDPRYTLHVSRQWIKPGGETIDLSGSWIDDPDYDPEYWKLLKKAMRGDGEALFGVAEHSEKNGNPFAAFMSYGLAVEYLPDGPLREMAMKRKEENQNALTPEKRSISDKALEQNIKKLQSLLKNINK
jgi:hypothetical protein